MGVKLNRAVNSNTVIAVAQKSLQDILQFLINCAIISAI